MIDRAAVRAQRAALVFEMAEMASHMVATTYRRRNPNASEAEVADHVRRWQLERPGAPDGDAPGVAAGARRLAR
jgi:Rv0078B-related antitoxin